MKTLGNIFAFLISIVYFFSLIVFALLLFASNIFSETYYTNILNDVELSEIKLKDLEEFGISEFEGYSSDDTSEDVFVGMISEAGLSEKDAQTIVNNEKINNTVGKLVSDIATYLVDQQEVPQIAEKDIKEIFMLEEISNALEEKPTDSEIKELTANINKELEILFKEDFSNAE